MTNERAVKLFDRLYINVLRKELDPQDEEYQNLKLLLEAGLRSCAICGGSNDQGDMIEYHGWCHVDCAHEYSQSLRVDPTTQLIGETDAQYHKRMEHDYPEL